MTEQKPLWKPGKEGSVYSYADYTRLEKEEPNTVLLLKKEEKYTNKSDLFQYWVNYHTKYGWSVARRAIAPKSEEGPEIEATHPEAKAPSNGTEPKPLRNGSFEYKAYWDKRQEYQEKRDAEIKLMHDINIATQLSLINVLERIAKALEAREFKPT